MPLAQLKKVDLRAEWKHEASNFTIWLSQQENLVLLGDELGYDLVLVGTEASVGNFYVDLLCEEQSTKKKIIIENQLEPTDHDHLGKLITYASGHSAGVAVWIVREVREEHRKAIDWLNEHTDEAIEFYLLKIELWQIGDSPYAPKFELVCKPNGWARSVREASAQGALSRTNLDQLEFWTQFKTYALSQGSSVRPQKPSPQHWISVSVGSAEACISLTVNSLRGLLGCELYIYDNKDLYARLLRCKREIEGELGEAVEWMELPRKKASRIKISTLGSLSERKGWDDHFVWLLKHAEQFQRVLSRYLKMLSLPPGTEEVV
jgi:hypothetical protein